MKWTETASTLVALGIVLAAGGLTRASAQNGPPEGVNQGGAAAEHDQLLADHQDIIDRLTRIEDLLNESVPRPFDVDAQWCFEAQGNYELKGKLLLEGAVKALGFVGLDAYGTGLKARVDTNALEKAGFEGGAQVALPKLVICMKGPLLKHLTGQQAVQQAALAAADGPTWEDLFADIALAQAKLRDDGPGIIDRFQLDAAKVSDMMDLAEEIDIDPEPAAILGDASQLLTDLANALPLNDTLRQRLQNTSAMVDKFRGRFQDLCNNLPPGFPVDLLDDVCAKVGDSEVLKDAVEETRDIVGKVQTTVGQVKTKVDKIKPQTDKIEGIRLQVFDNQNDHDGILKKLSPGN